jgi:hypothetical protein
MAGAVKRTRCGAYFDFAVYVGRSIMMDFGFAGFLDKFEKRFGERLTWWLLLLLALAVACFAVNMVFTFGIKPAYDGLVLLFSSPRLSWGDFTSVLSDAVTLISIVALTVIFIGRIDAKRTLSDSGVLLEDIKALFNDASNGMREAHAILLEAKEAAAGDDQRVENISRAIKKIEQSLEASGHRVPKNEGLKR